MSDGLVTRRALLGTALTGAAAACAAAAPRPVAAADRHSIYAQVEALHAEAVQRLQDWIRQPSIAAENRSMSEGCDLMMRLAREAGFQRVERVATDGQPGVFATLDAGAPRTLGLYAALVAGRAAPGRSDLERRDGGRDALGTRRELATELERLLLQAHREHRGARRRLHGPGRQDRAPAPRRREDGPAPRAEHDARRDRGEGAGAPREAGLRGHRDQRERRLRPDLDGRRLTAHSRADGGLPACRHRPILWPRRGGSWPGYVFTGAPLALPAGHFGLGHGGRAHAPDEYFVIESSNPKVFGYDAAVRSHIDYLFELA